MVNPILATIIKKASKGSMKLQTGGSEQNEQNVMKFLGILIIIIIIELMICDTIAREKVDNILTQSKKLSTTSVPNTSLPSISSDASVLGPGSNDDGTNVNTNDVNQLQGEVDLQQGENAPVVTHGERTPAGNVPENLKSKILTKEELKKYRKAINNEIYIPFMIINIVVIMILYVVFRKGNNNNVKNLFAISFSVMITSMLISYMVKVNKSNSPIFFSEYIGVSGYTAKQIGIGMMTNIIFGFIDNFGLFFGMDSLDDYLNFKESNDSEKADSLSKDSRRSKNIKGGAEDLAALRTAGWGNTFSDFLGAFVGNAVGDIASTLSGVERTPIISEIVGIVLGCILGIFIPAAMKREDSMLKGTATGIVDFLFFITTFGKVKSPFDV